MPTAPTSTTVTSTTTIRTVVRLGVLALLAGIAVGVLTGCGPSPASPTAAPSAAPTASAPDPAPTTAPHAAPAAPVALADGLVAPAGTVLAGPVSPISGVDANGWVATLTLSPGTQAQQVNTDLVVQLTALGFAPRAYAGDDDVWGVTAEGPTAATYTRFDIQTYDASADGAGYSQIMAVTQPLPTPAVTATSSPTATTAP